MRNFTLWLCFCVLSLAQVSVSYAAASEQEMVQDGRDLAFNGGVPTIAGLVAADQEFQDILAINSSNQQALFFRAITRVLVSVAEQGSGLLPIPNLMGAFGFFWNDAPISDPATPTGTDFLTSLDASIADLTRLIGLIAIDDQFTLTLRRTQVGSLQVNVGPDDVRVLKDMMVTVSDFMNLNAWDILDLKQLIINDTMGLLTEEQRTLLYKFVTPFGYSTIPSAPTAVSATAGNLQATVGFAAPVNDGGSAITGYTVTSNPAGGVDSNDGMIATTHTVTGLTNGTEYTFTVKATNAVGDSLDSAASKATPRTVPGAPTIGTATPGNAQATVSFTAPASNGGSAITGYMVTSSPAGGVDSNAGTIATPHTVTGLTNGTAYTFTVKATNVAGDSAASTASSSVMPLLIAAPASITVPTSDADGAYTVSWVTSTTAGVTYVLQESTNNSTFTTISPTVRTSGSIVSASITGRLTGRTYYYRVKATKTGYTDSDWRTGSNSCPVPGTLTSGVPASIAVPVSDADGAYSVSWGAALATTGVTYVLEEATNSTFTTGLRTAYTGTALTSPISGRSQDTTYYYRVKAIKPGLKDSAWRTGSNSCPVPGALTSGDPASIAVPVSDADGAYSVSWDAALATTEVTYVLEEATNSTFTAGRRTAYSGPALTSPISGRLQNTTYYYRVKAIKPGLKDSAWRTGNNSCPVPGTTTVATPPSLTFTAIILHGFTVNWGASTTIGVTYILEEATNSAFTAGLRTAYTGTARLVKITGRTKGVTYYYRVRAIKAGAKDSAKRTGSKVAT